LELGGLALLEVVDLLLKVGEDGTHVVEGSRRLLLVHCDSRKDGLRGNEVGGRRRGERDGRRKWAVMVDEARSNRRGHDHASMMVTDRGSDDGKAMDGLAQRRTLRRTWPRHGVFAGWCWQRLSGLDQTRTYIKTIKVRDKINFCVSLGGPATRSFLFRSYLGA
jgi:hypothetical protein